MSAFVPFAPDVRCRSALLAALAFIYAAAAQTEELPDVTGQPEPAISDFVRNSALIPGAREPAGVDPPNPYSGDAQAISNGERWYGWYNCSGCHAGGGGGMGPPLMDAQWIYGSRPANLYDSIVSGRPAGMPSFGAMAPPQHIWEIIAYIESMGGMPEHAPRKEKARSDSATTARGQVD